MSSSQGSYYKSQLFDDSMIPFHCDPSLEGVDGVYYGIRIEYILKKRTVHGQGDDEERLDLLREKFFLHWNYVLEADNEFFHRYFRTRGVIDHDVREGFACRLKDLASQMKARHSNINADREGNKVKIIASIKVYTVQQENETLDAAKVRAITSVQWFNRVIKSLKRAKVEVDSPEQEECCICLNKPCAGEEISFLQCLHPYHSKCIINWLEKKISCPLCRAPAVPSN